MSVRIRGPRSDDVLVDQVEPVAQVSTDEVLKNVISLSSIQDLHGCKAIVKEIGYGRVEAPCKRVPSVLWRHQPGVYGQSLRTEE